MLNKRFSTVLMLVWPKNVKLSKFCLSLIKRKINEISVFVKITNLLGAARKIIENCAKSSKKTYETSLKWHQREITYYTWSPAFHFYLSPTKWALRMIDEEARNKISYIQMTAMWRWCDLRDENIIRKE